MARTERESDRRRRVEKWQTLWCCRDQQRACRMAQASAEKLEQTGPAEKERVASVPQREQLARTPEPPLPKGKGTEPSVQNAPINSRLNVVVRSPAPFGLGRNGCWPSRGSQLPRALPIPFSLVAFIRLWSFFVLRKQKRNKLPTTTNYYFSAAVSGDLCSIEKYAALI